ncbi:MAG: hypothetical protein H0T11_05360 [Chthoniobacterales bacterium]|nr:hypothetical protein [Chthoniobacterales bacterium]
MSVLTNVRLCGKGEFELGGSGGKDLDFIQADIMAKRLRVKSLSKFVYFIDAELAHVAKVLNDFPDELAANAKIEKMWSDLQWALLDEVGPWHDADDGLQTIDALLASAAKDDTDDNLDASTVEDLKAIRRILLKARRSGTPFRLSQG